MAIGRMCVAWAAVFLCLMAPLGFAESQPEARKPVAMLFSRPVLQEELEPTPDELRADPARSPAQWRSDHLQAIVIGELTKRFCAEHPCEPTEEETRFLQDALGMEDIATGRAQQETRAKIAAELQSLHPTTPEGHAYAKTLQQSLERLDEEEQRRVSLPPNEQAVLEASSRSYLNEMAHEMVRTWKFHKVLYAIYGGVVIFQQATGHEPVGAYRAWLEEHERQGDFQIHDPTLRANFYDYFVRKHPFEVDENALRMMGLKNPFERPWWLMQPQVVAPGDAPLSSPSDRPTQP